MGSGNSTNTKSLVSKTKHTKSTEEVVTMMMPVYYTEGEISPDDLELAKRKWTMILDETSPHFLKLKGTEGYDSPSCIMLFYDSFYTRLFDVHPMSRPMFKSGLKSQGKFLVKMVSLALTLMNRESEFRDTMNKLAEVHNERGVKAVEYGIVGEVLFWSLRKCLGSEYDSATHKVWTKIFCRMLKIMVPVAVAYELRCGDAQIERLRLEASSIENLSKPHKSSLASKSNLSDSNGSSQTDDKRSRVNPDELTNEVVKSPRNMMRIEEDEKNDT